MTILQDLRHGARLLLRSPGFTLVAVAALAIGIGANTAIFSVVNTLLLQRLPYEDADRLAVLWEHNLPRDRKNNVVSPGNFLHWRELQQSFVDLAAVGGMSGFTFKITLTGAGEPEEVPYQMVSPSFFSILGVQPARGRAFGPDDEKPQSRVAIVSDALWRRRFNADPELIGRGITLAEESYTVVGIMPPGFSYLDKGTDVWVPLGFPAAARTPRGRWLSVMGRLKPGVTFEQAQRDMERVHAELTRQFPDFNTGWTARVVPLREQLTGDVRPALLFMLGAVAFVLLIACANVANLLLARATARRRELALRSALGAGRGRIVRQLMAESLVLAILGGLSGLLLAYWGLHLLRSAIAGQLPIQRLESVSIDGWVLGFTIAASLLSGLFFGLVPAFSASGTSLTDALKEGGRTGSAAAGKRTRSGFVVAEVALALVLLVGAGLLVRSFVRVTNVDPGFDAARTVSMSVSLPAGRCRDGAARDLFFTRLFDQIDALPGVDASGATSFLPISGLGAATRFDIVGAPPPPRGEEPVCDVRVVANDYFRSMGIPLMKGRLFRQGDQAT
jgi:putative ABC transport system permease protein